MAKKVSKVSKVSKVKKVGAKEGGTRNPYAVFEREFAEKVIRPHILEIVQQYGEPNSKQHLLEVFRRRTNSTVSMPTFNRWLKLAGIEFATYTSLSIPKTHSLSDGDAPSGPRPLPEDDDDVRFDNEDDGDILHNLLG